MASGFGQITPYVNTYVKLYTADAVATAVNSIPNIPPILKLIGTAAATGIKVKIIKDFVQQSDVPPAAKALAGAVFSIGQIQTTISLIGTLQGMISGGNIFGATGKTGLAAPGTGYQVQPYALPTSTTTSFSIGQYVTIAPGSIDSGKTGTIESFNGSLYTVSGIANAFTADQLI